MSVLTSIIMEMIKYNWEMHCYQLEIEEDIKYNYNPPLSNYLKTLIPVFNDVLNNNLTSDGILNYQIDSGYEFISKYIIEKYYGMVLE